MAKTKKAKPAPVVDPSQVFAENQEKLKFYAKWAMILVALALVVSFLIGFMNDRSNKKLSLANESVGNFESTVLTEFNDGKITEVDFLNKATEVVKDLDSSAPFLSIMSSVFDKLKTKPELKDQFSSFLNLLQSKSNHSLSTYYYNLYSSVHHEEHGNYAEAIKSLKKNFDSDVKLEEKTYLDLGRLYLLNNQKEEAKTNFNYLISKFPKSQEADLAKIYANKNGLSLE